MFYLPLESGKSDPVFIHTNCILKTKSIFRICFPNVAIITQHIVQQNNIMVKIQAFKGSYLWWRPSFFRVNYSMNCIITDTRSLALPNPTIEMMLIISIKHQPSQNNFEPWKLILTTALFNDENLRELWSSCRLSQLPLPAI